MLFDKDDKLKTETKRNLLMKITKIIFILLMTTSFLRCSPKKELIQFIEEWIGILKVQLQIARDSKNYKEAGRLRREMMRLKIQYPEETKQLSD